MASLNVNLKLEKFSLAIIVVLIIRLNWSIKEIELLKNKFNGYDFTNLIIS
jgi:hypothetical protein